MARDYEFINGPETSEVPTASDAVLDSETPSYGQVKKEFTSRQSVGNSVSNIAALKALVTQAGAPFDRVADQVLQVNARDSFYRWVPTSMLASDDFVIVRPSDVASDASAGRWLLVNSAQPTFLDDTAATNFFGAKLVKGQQYFDDTAKKQKVYNGTAWIISGGGGVGSASVFALLNSDDDLTTWATGNNASFLGGGSLAGTFNKADTATPLSGLKSYSYTQAAGSLNDYFSSALIDVPRRSRGKEIGITLPFTYDGADNDLKAIAYDVTNSAILSSSLDLVKKTNGSVNTQLVQIFIPSTCEQIRFGFQVLVANAGKILRFDDVEFSDSPFAYKASQIRQNFIISTLSSSLVGAYGNTFQLLGFLDMASPDNASGDEMFYISSGPNGQARFIAKRKGLFFGGVSLPLTAGWDIRVLKNGVQILEGVGPSSNNYRATIPFSFELNQGDFLEFGCVYPNGYGTGFNLNISAIAESDNVLAPMKNPKQYDLAVTGSGWTTTRAKGVVYKTGDGAYRLKFNLAGTVSASSSISLSLAGVTFKNGSNQSVSTSGGGNYTALGYALQNSSTLNLSATSASTVYYASGDVELEGRPTWADDVSSQYMALVPIQRTAYIKDVKPNGTQGGTFTAGTWVTRDLNTLEGDTSFVSLRNNIFEITVAGEYLIEAEAPVAYLVNNHQAGIATELSNIPDIKAGGNMIMAAYGANLSRVNAKVVITSPMAYKILHKCVSTQGTYGLGMAGSLGVDEVYTQVKITKVK